MPERLKSRGSRHGLTITQDESAISRAFRGYAVHFGTLWSADPNQSIADCNSPEDSRATIERVNLRMDIACNSLARRSCQEPV